MRIVVSGSTGLIGTALVQALKLRSHEVLPLVRRRVAVGEQAVAWDPERGMIDRDGLEGIDVVIHLAGENVFGRWSAAKKQRIRESRVQGTRLLSDAIAATRRSVNGARRARTSSRTCRAIGKEPPPPRRARVFASSICDLGWCSRRRAERWPRCSRRSVSAWVDASEAAIST